MNLDPLILATSTMLPASLGLLGVLYLRGSLRRVLTDVCGDVNRADFWTRMAAVGFIVVPIALSLRQAPVSHDQINWFLFLRNLLGVGFDGVFLVLAGLGFAMWRQTPRQRVVGREKILS